MSQQKQDQEDTSATGPPAVSSSSPTSPPPQSPPQLSPPFKASTHSNDGKKHLLLGVSGSVATIKLVNIAGALSRHGNLSIVIVATESATRFLDGQSDEQPPLSSLLEIPNVDYIFGDEDEWRPAWRRGASVLHIELRRWAHLLVIAPLSANSLAKIVAGFSDNLLLSVVRAWDTVGTGTGTSGSGVAAAAAATTGIAQGTVTAATAPARRATKTIVVAPAMNTAMWTHPMTEKQIRVLEDEWGVDRGHEINNNDNGNSNSYSNSNEINNNNCNSTSTSTSTAGRSSNDNPSYSSPSTTTDTKAKPGWFKVLRPQRKTLACGDVGDGAMREWTEIVREIEEELGLV